MNKEFPNTKFGTLVLAQPKSNIKAGEGKTKGIFPFFTSSPVQTKYLNKYIYQGPAIIFGTGGGASVHACEGPFATSTDCLVYYPASKKVYIKYLYRYLLGNIHILQRGFKGAGLQHISKTYIENLDIPFPNIKEQESIVERLDKVQKLIALQREQLKKLDDLIKSRFVDLFGNSKSNPKRFPLKKLHTISNVSSSKRVFVNELVEDGVPFYRGTEIGALAEGKQITPELFITKEHYKELSNYTGKVNRGDLLLPSICPDGRIWQVKDDTDFYFKDGRVLWIRPNLGENSTYLRYALKELFQSDYAHIASGTTFAELKIFTLKTLNIMYPSMELQTQFADFVTKIESQKDLLTTRLSHLETLYKSLMQEYFG